jgi:glyoxylase-like metal-dependent hydrolase (beta-lactamase superfamily II)
MVKITERIKFVEAPNKAKFPYCHCLLIEDDKRVLIDTSFGPEHLQDLIKTPIDIIVNTHFHEDHILNNYHFPEAAVWMHPLDAPGSRSLDTFLEYYGFADFGGEKLGQEFIDSIDLHASPVHHEFVDGEILDFGHVQLRVVHTPGHTPGHCAFYQEKTGLLFSADIDLSGFGPWYAHRCSNIDDFIVSIQKCIALDPQIIVSSHKGIITDDIPARLQKYVEVIYRKEDEIIDALQVPQTVAQLADRQIIYGADNSLTPLLLWFEKMAVAQHLQRLIKHNEAEQSEGIFYLK